MNIQSMFLDTEQVVTEARVCGWEKLRWKFCPNPDDDDDDGGFDCWKISSLTMLCNDYTLISLSSPRVHAWVESKDFYYKLGFRLF